MTDIANITIRRLISLINDTVHRFSQRYESVLNELDTMKNEILVQSVLAREFYKTMNNEINQDNDFFLNKTFWMNKIKKRYRILNNPNNLSHSHSMSHMNNKSTNNAYYCQNGKDNQPNGNVKNENQKVTREEILKVLREIQKDTRILYGKKSTHVNSYKASTKEYKTDIIIDNNITITIKSKSTPTLLKEQVKKNQEPSGNSKNNLTKNLQIDSIDKIEDISPKCKKEVHKEEIKKEKNKISLPKITNTFNDKKLEGLFVIYRNNFIDKAEQVPLLFIKKALTEKINKKEILNYFIEKAQQTLKKIPTSSLLSDKKLIEKISKYPTRKSKAEINNITKAKENAFMNSDTFHSKELSRIICSFFGLEVETNKHPKEIYSKLFKKYNATSMKNLFQEKIFNRVYVDCSTNKKVLSLIDNIKIYYNKVPISYIETTLNELYDFISSISNLSSSNIPRLKNSLQIVRYENYINTLNKKLKV